MKSQVTQPTPVIAGHSPSDIAARTVLPPAGRWMIGDWAAIHNCSVETVRNNIATYKIKTIRSGRTIIIKAEWWWDALEGREPT